jgi:predicted transcriptional regulator with HTH domain
MQNRLAGRSLLVYLGVLNVNNQNGCKMTDYEQKLIDLVQEGVDDLQAVGAYAESAGLETKLLELLKEMNK